MLIIVLWHRIIGSCSYCYQICEAGSDRKRKVRETDTDAVRNVNRKNKTESDRLMIIRLGKNNEWQVISTQMDSYIDR